MTPTERLALSRALSQTHRALALAIASPETTMHERALIYVLQTSVLRVGAEMGLGPGERRAGQGVET